VPPETEGEPVSYGAAWDSFLKDFKSKRLYEQRIQDFAAFIFRSTGKKLLEFECDELIGLLIRYFDFNHGLKNPEGTQKYAGTTLRSWFSIFLKFWRYTGRGNLREQALIIEDNIGKWEKEQTVVKEQLGEFGKRIATMLGLENAANFTGHCWRRTATTFCAESGLTIPQMKQVTGHKSDTVVQGYIDRTELMKRKAAVALATSAQEPAVSTSEPSDVHLTKSHCREGLITINIYNSTFTGHGDSPVINFSGSTFNI